MENRGEFMPVSFNQIVVGKTYSRPDLAQLWGYAGYQALARGVVTPQNDDKIILFVTHEKQESFEQYQDELKGNDLTWEGPTDHFAEERMINAKQNGDEIHLFYRDRHHSDFTYEGEFEVISCQPSTTNPSKFKLQRK
jgi:putative restriction endonuclease